MSYDRWHSPFSHSLTFKLFNQHFTELNAMYWANIPVENKIKKLVKETCDSGTEKPLDFFIVHDEDDRRIAPDFDSWDKTYNDFGNYTRLNMLMSLSSCLEVYLRSIVSMSIESKPAVIFNSEDALDGVYLLKHQKNYAIFNEATYPFHHHVLSVTQGDWASRTQNYKKLFGNVPKYITDNIHQLDELRKLRNDIGHYFGRPKQKYEAPLQFLPEHTIRVSHNRLIKFFALVDCTAKEVDLHLYQNFIGSYEVLKLFTFSAPLKVKTQDCGMQAKWLQKYIGRNTSVAVGSKYYKDLFSYYDSI